MSARYNEATSRGLRWADVLHKLNLWVVRWGASFSAVQGRCKSKGLSGVLNYQKCASMISHEFHQHTSHLTAF